MQPPIFPKLLLLALLLMGVTVASYAAEGGTVAGNIVDASTGQPLPFGNILILGTQFGAMTLDDGTFLINNIPPGTYTFLATYI